MPRDRDERHSRFLHDDDYIIEQPARDHDQRSHRRRHRPRDYDDDSLVAKRERRERRELRRAEEAQRQAELDLHELRARRESYYSRSESDRRREPQRMAQEIRIEREKAKPRAALKEVRRSSTRRRPQKDVRDDRSEDYVYGRPQSRDVAQEVVPKRSGTLRGGEEGGSSRTGHSPQSGSRSASLRAAEVPKLARSASARDSTRPYMATRRRASTTKHPTVTVSPVRTRSTPVREIPYSPPHRRSTGGLLATLFKPPARGATLVQKEAPRVDCLVCMNDDLPIHKTAKLGCGHRMCHSCLRRQFTLSVSDPQHMPPKCCTADHIPLKYVERLFDDKFKKLWNKKYQEYTTGNRLYCPTKGCGEWIKPGKVRMDLTYGRKYARCGRCHTKVCVLCNSKFHTRRECPKDEETNRVVQMAKDQGWQRCYSCKAVVELKEGCNHMTCRCSAQFCMVCALPWKTCNCPWFNYNHITDGDRLSGMRVPYDTREEIVEVVEMPISHAPPSARRPSTRSRHRPDLDLVRADEALAAHLQALQFSSPPSASEHRRTEPSVQMYSLGNSDGHHMNESYTVQPMGAAAGRTGVRVSSPRFFSRRLIPTRDPAPAPVPLRSPRPAARPAVRAVSSSVMAGLSRDGTKRGANRVGTWLDHVQVDLEAISTAPQNVEVDYWRMDGSLVGID